jgi:hypothetical protein
MYWDDIPHVDHDPPGPCRLGVASAGAYDVGARTMDYVGAALARDRVVGPGETVGVVLRVPRGRPVMVVPPERWPFQADLESGRIHLVVEVVDEIPGGEWFPGRDDTLDIKAHVTTAGKGAWRSPPLPRGVNLRVRTTLFLDHRRKAHEDERPVWTVVAEPEVVRAGGTVRLRAVPAAWLLIRPRAEDPRSWPTGGLEVVFRLSQDGSSGREWTRAWGGVGELGREDASTKSWMTLPARPGVASLSWDGEGILPGEATGIRLQQGPPTVLDVILRQDPRELPAPQDIEVELRGLPEPTPGREALPVSLEALLSTDDEDRPERLEHSICEGEPRRLDWGWRRAAWLLASAEGGLVSRPVPIPREGGVTVELEPGGYLVVVPARALGDDLGEVRVRRKDGRPFLAGGMEGWEDSIHESVEVSAGTNLGPLPAGTYTFAVTIAGVPQPDVTVTVRPGRFAVLPIAR